MRFRRPTISSGSKNTQVRFVCSLMAAQIRWIFLADGRTPRSEPAVLGVVPRGAALVERTACQEPTPKSEMRSRSSSPTRNGATDREVGGHCRVRHTLVGQTCPSASVSKRQIGERKLRRGDTVYDMKVSPRKAGRADCETNLTIVKTRGGVAHFFHNGPSACHNNMAFLTLWRQTIVKMASDFFHNGPAGCRLGSNHGEKPVS